MKAGRSLHAILLLAAVLALCLGGLALGQDTAGSPRAVAEASGDVTLYTYVVADTWVNEFAPDANYGHEDRMIVGSDACGGGESPVQGLALLRFALGPGSAPPGMVVKSARLEVYTRHSEVNPPLSVAVHRVMGPWAETLVTWNTQPGHSAAAYAVADVSDLIGGWNTWDVTDLVRQWLEGTCANHGLSLMAATDCNWRAFDSRESIGQARMVIVFGEPAPTPTPTTTLTPRPTNTPGPTPTWVPGASPRVWLPVVMRE